MLRAPLPYSSHLSVLGVLLLGSWLVACKPDIPDGRFACQSNADCPAGFSCSAARCTQKPVDEVDSSTEPGARTEAEAGSMEANVDAGTAASVDAAANAATDANGSPDATGASPGADAAPVCVDALCADAFECTIDRCGVAGCEHVPDDTRCTEQPDGRCDAASGCRYPTCSEATCQDTACENARCEAGQCVKTPVCAASLTCCNGTCWSGRCEELEACRDKPADSACRPASDACDLAELCSGQDNTCPSDRKAPVGTPCTGGSCNGLGQCIVGCIQGTACATSKPCERGQLSCATDPPTCVPVGPASASTECRAAAGPCDVAEKCDGVSTTCPADVLRGGDVVCRASAGVCDAPESCAGNSPSCPANQFAPSSVPCRGAVAECDVTEYCTGGAAACPADGFQPPSNVCRPAAGECDSPESCTGSHPSCPANVLRSGDLCRGSAGDCDVAEVCDGSNPSCPPDGFLGTTRVCRSAAFACDLTEVCPGNSPSCPADARQGVGEGCGECSHCNEAGACVYECGARICCEGQCLPPKLLCP